MKDFDYIIIRLIAIFLTYSAMALRPFYKLWIRFMGNDFLRDRAIRKAIRKHKRDNRRYRVGFHLGRWRVYNRDQFKDWKRTGFFGRLATLTGLDANGYIEFDTNTL